MAKEKNVNQFDRDVQKNTGYLYTATTKLSSRLANQRLSESVLDMVDLKGKKVIDLGCGDGTYTLEFVRQKPKSLMGVDASKMAILSARKKAAGLKGVRFQAMDIYDVGSLKGGFDVAVVRGLLHHLYDARKAIMAISKVAKTIVVIEPNGYNPVLKGLEKFSKYHVEHEEKSFPPHLLRRWFEENGGTLTRTAYYGLVPFFCPDWMARILKVVEPFFEKMPLLKQVSCAVFVFKVSFQKK